MAERKPFLFLLILLTCMLFSVKAAGSAPAITINVDTLPIFTSLEDALKNPVEVYRLHLKRNRYTEIPAEVFTFTNLIDLDLSNNRIEVIPDGIASLNNLQSLRMGNNRLHTVSDSIGKLTVLQSLALSRNHLVIIPATIGDLKKLTSFEVWRNEIGDLPAQVGELAGTLKYIDIRQNPYPPENIEKLKTMLPETEVKSSRRCACSGG